ncbi:DUF1499 domain-containing protein [Pannus brasiliensis CCIBt3594]|uniref:DUF1499 domain-containing protein n=1 Tax=Pannus brasiliensis CCIBt3594 TaxID=1427578 RepID=A0AAW9R0I0_9CHRO
MNPTSTPKKRPLLPIALLAIVLVWVGIRLFFPDIPSPFAGSRPDTLGVVSGKLHPCPNTPNCVSSQSADVVHSIEPIPYTGTPGEAIEKIAAIVESQPRTKIIARESNYLYAEFASQWMGFVDDVEFYADPDKKAIEVRSASRLGESDLNVNRQRVETIRSLF